MGHLAAQSASKAMSFFTSVLSADLQELLFSFFQQFCMMHSIIGPKQQGQ